MKEKDFKSSVEKMLLKKAMGYKVKENVDEYASVGEEMKLVKRRITTKYVSPTLPPPKPCWNSTEGRSKTICRI